MELEELILLESHDRRASPAGAVTEEHDDAQTSWHARNKASIAREGEDDDDDAIQGRRTWEGLLRCSHGVGRLSSGGDSIRCSFRRRDLRYAY
jgi:hypothetical protein